MKLIYFLLFTICFNLIGCVVEEPVYPVYETVYVDGYWEWQTGVRVWVPGRYSYRRRAYIIHEHREYDRHYRR